MPNVERLRKQAVGIRHSSQTAIQALWPASKSSFNPPGLGRESQLFNHDHSMLARAFSQKDMPRYPPITLDSGAIRKRDIYEKENVGKKLD